MVNVTVAACRGFSALLSKPPWTWKVFKILDLFQLTAALISSCRNTGVSWNFHVDDKTWVFFVRRKSTSRSSPPLSRCQSEYTMNIFDCNTAFDVVASCSALIIFNVKWHNYWGSIAKLSAVIGEYLQAEKCAEQRTTDLFLNGCLVSRSNRDLHLIITIFACQF